MVYMEAQVHSVRLSGSSEILTCLSPFTFVDPVSQGGWCVWYTWKHGLILFAKVVLLKFMKTLAHARRIQPELVERC